MEQSARIHSEVIEKTIKSNTYENNVLNKLESEDKKVLSFNLSKNGNLIFNHV